MRKFLSLWIVSLLFANFAFAQTILEEDDFESYDVDAFISTADFWTTWGGSTGGTDDAHVSDAFNHTSGGSKSLKIVEGNDIVAYFGDKASGKYQIDFYYYVAAGNGGYFNIQHVFGSEWAFSVNFNDGGNAIINYNGTNNTTIPFPQDEWFPVSMTIDLDADLISLTINNATPTEWQFSTLESGGDAENVLDCINFYGTATAGTAEYYVDDFVFTEVVSGTTPAELEVNVNEVTLIDGPQSFTVSNIGQDPLTYKVFAYYPPTATQLSASNATESHLNRSNHIAHDPLSSKNTDAESFLSYYDGTLAASIGWNDPLEVHAAVLFDHDFIKEHIGMYIDRVEITCGENMPNGSPTVEIWDGYENNSGGPANLLTTQSFTPVTNELTVVELDNPVFISGTDLWVGWTFTDAGADNFSLGTDAGPPVQDVNYIKTGVAWSAINDEARGNFGISGVTSGEHAVQWLNIDVTEGTINGGENQVITLTPDMSNLAADTYHCTIVIKNNDQDEYWTEIPVSFDYDDIDEYESTRILSYPNPATESFTIQSNLNITNIQITNNVGQMVYDTKLDQVKNTTIDISSFAKGIYHVNIKTKNGITTTKLVVE